MIPNGRFEVTIEGKRFVAHGDRHGRIGSVSRWTPTGEILLWDALSGRGANDQDVRRVLAADPCPSSYVPPGRG